jgi:hypothetical protein
MFSRHQRAYRLDRTDSNVIAVYDFEGGVIEMEGVAATNILAAVEACAVVCRSRSTLELREQPTGTFAGVV